MRSFAIVFILVAANAFVAPGCDAERPTAPSNGLGGRWTGTITRGADRGSIEWELTQTGAGASGTWAADFELGADLAGSAGGTVLGSRASLFLTPATGLTCDAGIALSGTLNVDATLSGDRLMGTYVTFTCGGVETGTVDVTRH